MGYTRLDGEYQFQSDTPNDTEYVATSSKKKRGIVLNIVLFILTFVSCSIAGVSWMMQDFSALENIPTGFLYAVLMMGFISAHEFGHYIAARLHKVDASLPYYIPMPFVTVFPFGTMGAVIKTRSPIPSRKALFDIGVAGPLAGFVVCVIYLIVGFSTLPSIDYLYQIHPEYSNFGGLIPTFGMYFGDTILFATLQHFFQNPNGFMPPMNEVYHYPFLCVGWFGLFVTAMNLLPVGQLDGGHILYAMYGKIQGKVARVVVGLMILVSIGGFIEMLSILIAEERPDALYEFTRSILLSLHSLISQHAPWFLEGYGGWLFWAILAKFFFRFDHPPIDDQTPLDTKRMIVGWLAVLIFILSISYNGIYERYDGLMNGIESKTVVIENSNHSRH
jgi:membrane-associated protease RseP (regulator of RpoE activity)